MTQRIKENKLEEIQITQYRCEICGKTYDLADEAIGCEERPLQDSPVKVGDIVLITGGQGTGSKAKVTNRTIMDKYWGHHAWKRYWHTVSVIADIIDSYGTRMLTFDQYEIVNEWEVLINE